jgi:glucose-1-phosphate thymidylyltransferase
VLLKTVMMIGDERSRTAGRRSEERLTALERVANRPIIHHVLDGLSEVSTDGLIVVSGVEMLGHVEASLDHYEHSLGSVDYVAWRASRDIGALLADVAPIIGDAACILHPADGLFDSSAAVFASVCDTKDFDVVLLSRTPVEQYTTGGWAPSSQSAAPQVCDQPEEPQIAVLAAGMLARAARSGSLSHDNRSLSTLGRSFASYGAAVDLKEIEGWYRYSGDERQLLELNRIALNRIVAEVPDLARRNNKIEGPVRIEQGATIRSSVVVGPAVIGPGAIVSDSYIGPYTAVGAGARIEGSEIERSIVHAGASVLHVGTRLVSSLVGRDARVMREFGLPRALRLWVGDGDEIALC